MIIAELEYCIPGGDWCSRKRKLEGQAEEDYRRVLAAREEDEYTDMQCTDFPSLRRVLSKVEEDCRELALDELECAGDPDAEELASRVWVRFVGDD